MQYESIETFCHLMYFKSLYENLVILTQKIIHEDVI